METVKSLYGLHISCPHGREQEYKDYMEDILPIFRQMSDDVENGKFQGDFVRAFGAQPAQQDDFLLFIGLSHNQMFVSCGTIDNNEDIKFTDHCTLDEIKAFSLPRLEYIGYRVYKMANVVPDKMPDLFNSKLNEKWRMLTSHFRSLSKEEQERLQSPVPKEDEVSPVNYLFDKRVDEALKQAHHVKEEKADRGDDCGLEV